MQCCNEGTLRSKSKLEKEHADIIRKFFKHAYVSGNEVTLEDEPGAILLDLQEMVEELFDIGVELEGMIRFYGDADGGYDVHSPKVTSLDYWEYVIREIDTDDLLAELRRRHALPGNEEAERLRDILRSAIGELYESAEDWYREEIPGLIGTTEEELKKLNIT